MEGTASDTAMVLRRARQQAGLTIRALAEAAGTSHPTIVAYEAGRVTPRADTLNRLLRACGTELAVTRSRTPERDPRRGPPDQEFLQVLSLIDAVGETPREQRATWTAPIFRRLA